MFADDTTLCCNLVNGNVSEETINYELVKLTEWLACNQLSLNVNKTKFMFFHRHVHCLCYVIHVLFYRLISYICVCKLIAHKQLCSYFIDFFNAISIPQGGFLTKYYENG